jgi:hypothetical protein
MHPDLVTAAWGRAMNIMSVNGYQAKIEYDAELDMFRGEILGLNGSADFYGRTPEELRAEFQRSLQVFLEVCREEVLSRGGTIRESSTSGYRQTCMSASPFSQRPRGRA